MAAKDLGYEKTLAGAGFEDAIAKVTEALKAEGFGVLTEIDVKATLAKKLGVDVPRYTILGSCNPVLAHKAIGLDPAIGLLLPCNVVVRDTDAGVHVAIANPGAMFAAVDDPALQPIADEADARLRRVAEAL